MKVTQQTKRKGVQGGARIYMVSRDNDNYIIYGFSGKYAVYYCNDVTLKSSLTCFKENLNTEKYEKISKYNLGFFKKLSEAIKFCESAPENKIEKSTI